MCFGVTRECSGYQSFLPDLLRMRGTSYDRGGSHQHKETLARVGKKPPKSISGQMLVDLQTHLRDEVTIHQSLGGPFRLRTFRATLVIRDPEASSRQTSLASDDPADATSMKADSIPYLPSSTCHFVCHVPQIPGWLSGHTWFMLLRRPHRKLGSGWVSVVLTGRARYRVEESVMGMGPSYAVDSETNSLVPTDFCSTGHKEMLFSAVKTRAIASITQFEGVAALSARGQR